jgi:hypothetical protein
MTNANVAGADLDEDDGPDLTKIADMSDREALSVILETLNRACKAMDNRSGISAGYYTQMAQRITAMTGAPPQAIDDYDLAYGGVYLAQDAQTKPVDYAPALLAVMEAEFDAAFAEEALFDKLNQAKEAMRAAEKEVDDHCLSKVRDLIAAGKADEAYEFTHRIPQRVTRAFAIDALRQSGWKCPE